MTDTSVTDPGFWCCSVCFQPSDPFLGPADSCSHLVGCPKIGNDERHAKWLESVDPNPRTKPSMLKEIRERLHEVKRRELSHTEAMLCEICLLLLSLVEARTNVDERQQSFLDHTKRPPHK